MADIYPEYGFDNPVSIYYYITDWSVITLKVNMARPKNPEIRSERQQQILEAARQIFGEHGLAEARMDDIALAARLSKGTLYLYYKSKDDLVVGLLEALFSQALVQLRASIELPGLTAEARMIHYVERIVSLMESDASLLNISYEFYAVAARRPAVRDYLQTYFGEYRGLLAALLEQGKARGEYPLVDSGQAALTLVALLEGCTLLWFTDHTAVNPRQTLPVVIRQFFNGLT